MLWGLDSWIEHMYDQDMRSAAVPAGEVTRDLAFRRRAEASGAEGAARGGGGAAAAVDRVRDFRQWLASVCGDAASDVERLELLSELESVKASLVAAQARVTHVFAESQERAHVAAGGDPRTASRSIGSQIALARRESPSSGDRHLGLARALVRELPCTMSALTAGRGSEWAALQLLAACVCSTAEVRAEVDARVGDRIGSLTPRQVGRAAARFVAELDAAGVAARRAAAAASRRVSVRPAPDGMAYLTILGPLLECVGAYAALRAHAAGVAAGTDPAGELPQGRGAGPVMVDAALRRLSGRTLGERQPVAVNLVMTDRALTGIGDPTRSAFEPAHIVGHGPVPAAEARDLLRDEQTHVWLRRLFSTPDGSELAILESSQRLVSGTLRRAVVLRDDRCRTPWCDAPIAVVDHVQRYSEGGATSLRNTQGLCVRCNLTKEEPGWRSSPDPDIESRRHRVTLTTPTGLTYESVPPPLLGWGSPWTDAPDPVESADPLDDPLHPLHGISEEMLQWRDAVLRAEAA